MSKIISSSFVMSCAYISQAMEDDKKEICFIGRSNVGKSSLINMLTNKKKLAKKSSTPGKTRLINFFDIDFQNEEKENFSCRFVDLPGLGYAKVSKEMKKDWGLNIKDFIEKRENIIIFIYLVDARHRELDIDRNSLEYFQSIKQEHQHILKVFTKADKITKNKARGLKSNKNNILVSSFDRNSINELSEKIYNLALGNLY